MHFCIYFPHFKKKLLQDLRSPSSFLPLSLLPRGKWSKWNWASLHCAAVASCSCLTSCKRSALSISAEDRSSKKEKIHQKLDHESSFNFKSLCFAVILHWFYYDVKQTSYLMAYLASYWMTNSVRENIQVVSSLNSFIYLYKVPTTRLAC